MRGGQWRRSTTPSRWFLSPTLPLCPASVTASAQHLAIRRWRFPDQRTEMRMYAPGHDTAPFFPQGFPPGEIPGTARVQCSIGVAFWSSSSSANPLKPRRLRDSPFPRRSFDDSCILQNTFCCLRISYNINLLIYIFFNL